MQFRRLRSALPVAQTTRLVSRSQAVVLRRPLLAKVLAYALLAALFVGAIVVLVLFNLSLTELWSELVYAIVITTLVLWELGRIPPIKRLLDYLGQPGLSIKRAFVWTTFVLVAIPLAIVQAPYGVVLLLLPPLAWAVLRFLRWRRDRRDPEAARRGSRWWYPPSVGVAGGILAVLFVATVPPHVQAARESEAAPAAAEPVPEEQTLAESVRPILRFDEGERHFPVDIATAMSDGKIKACREALSRDPCTAVETSEQIDLGADYLDVEDISGGAGGGDDSAYYYRVHRRKLLFVDYWWYFTRNPTPVASGIFCGAGFRLAGKTCHEHPSDWEGVTVVLGPCSEGRACVPFGEGRWQPVAVRYSQHEFLVSYAWRPTLVHLWRAAADAAAKDRRGRGVVGDPLELWRTQKPDAAGSSAGEPLRPVIFVARDSHASYPRPCRRNCGQVRRLVGLQAPESAHDGRLPWTENGTECDECLQPLPLTDAEEPAEWNAFERRWGDQHCLLGGAYCDTSRAPPGPSEQSRYEQPWQRGRWLCLEEPADLKSMKLRPCTTRLASPEDEIPRD